MSWLTKIFSNRSDIVEDDQAVDAPQRNRQFGMGANGHAVYDAEGDSIVAGQDDAVDAISEAAFEQTVPQDVGAEENDAAPSEGYTPLDALLVTPASSDAPNSDHDRAVVAGAAFSDAFGRGASRSTSPKADGSRDALPRFTALGNQRSTPQAVADRMLPLRRAFTPSHPISDTALFAGRRDLLKRLIHLIEDQGLHVVLYGDRGIGKTSLLRVLADLAEQGHYKVTYSSCGSDTDFDSLFRSLAREVPLLYHADYEPISPEVEAGGTFADLLPERKATVVDVTEIFEALRGTQLLIFIDEFDRCESDLMREQVAELIKNLSDRGVGVQCVIAGVASNLTALVSHIPSIRRNLIGLPLGPLSDRETRELLQNAAQRSGVPFTQASVDRLIHFSNGLPYLNQLLGLHSTIVAVKDGAVSVSEAHVNAALAQALEEIRLRLSSRGLRSADKVGDAIGWERLGELARKALLQVGVLNDGDVAGLPSSEVNEILVYSSDDEGDRWSFKEEAVVPYVWMKSQVSGF